MLQTIAVCDVDLVHQSHISDEEELRFQLGVAVYGLERGQHSGGKAYRWGEAGVHHRRGVRLRLVNVGASAAIARYERLGYPICTVCGQSVSPLSSDRQRDHFNQTHQEWCGRPPTPVGFYADITADVLSLPGCPDQATAYSLLETLRFAATRVFDMHMDDLQVLVIGHVDRDDVDALLWDPMPGGSGLIDQICDRFNEVIAAAREVVANCPALCETSCVDCLQTFRNGYYHKHLFRKLALEWLDERGPRLRFAHEIPPQQPASEPGAAAYPVNEAERKLRHLLLAAGFGEGVRDEQLRLDRAIGTTTPDVIYRADHHEPDEGVCIYLDGLSAHIHGNPKTAEKDAQIRTWLCNNGYDVIEIVVSDLDDKEAMTRHFRRLAGFLREDDIKRSIKADPDWFSRAKPANQRETRTVYRLVQPQPDDYFQTCVPLVPLQFAAGAFGDPQYFDHDRWQWVEIDTHRKLIPGMFVAQVVGKSMEPLIPDKAHCLFVAPVTGSRQGRTVVVQLNDGLDPETGERYTVKTYSSEKSPADDGGWRHVKVVLKPRNPDFAPIVLTGEEEGNVEVVAEFLDVLG